MSLELSRESAALLRDEALRCGRELDEWLARTLVDLPESDRKHLRRAVGTVLACISLDVLNPIFRTHPDLRPEQYDAP